MDGEQTIESLEVEEIVYEQIIRTKEGYTNTGKFIFTKTKMMLVAKKILVKKNTIVAQLAQANPPQSALLKSGDIFFETFIMLCPVMKLNCCFISPLF